MASRFEAVSALIAAEFVVMSVVVLLLVPIEAAAPILPLLLVLSFALYRYLT